MDSSDDEGVVSPLAISGYYFEDAESRPISFAELPVQWSEAENTDCAGKEIYLRGAADKGLLKVLRQVTAWKYNISLAKPEILVLSKDNNWIKLEKPRNSFEEIIRTILITVNCLHFVKRNPDVSGKVLWDRLSRVFSLYDPRPSENDLIDHIDFIGEAVKRDEALGKSKFLAAFLEEKPSKRKAVSEGAGTLTRPDFIVDDVTEEPEDDFPIKDAEDEESDEENDPFDSVCAICDNGGDLLCCDGKCLRSFHATEEAGSESSCQSLGLTVEEVEATQTFICENCQHDIHQCYVCGELGSSKKSTGAEVFQCSSATCGYFYHPQCVAKLIHRESEVEAKDLQEKIAAGDPFTCPVHKCVLCKKAENEDNTELQFATCRRCPKSYHKKCMPRKIVLWDSDDEDVEARAWPNLLPKKRLLIYCLKHEIDDELKTPSRDHIKFPYSEQFRDSGLKKKKKKRASESVPEKKSSVKPSKGVEKLSSVEKHNNSSKKRLVKLSVPESSKKQKIVHTSEKPLNKSSSSKVKKSVPDENQKSLGNMLYDLMTKGSGPIKSKEDIPSVGEHQHTQTPKLPAQEAYSSPPLDNDSKNRILAMMKEATSSVTLEEVIKKHKVPTTHTHASRNLVDKSITLGKVERSVEALRLAVKKLDEGCSIDDAKAVCDARVLEQILKWKNKLRVYLAPFLHGMRYTSFGRHFTKEGKLKEIVDILHWYVKEGDTIVDFCCGANDFSSIMKEKLDEVGKQCSYKNYDILQAKFYPTAMEENPGPAGPALIFNILPPSRKVLLTLTFMNDFNFEKRDWMTVQPKELPPGSQLIMGLNPPFGVNASLANKFVDKALQFKPKLIILIVPPETERLDRKHPPYDLIWEDAVLLAGKSFYLPGSVDINDKQIDQWNNTAPPLYLWSRQDWTSKHKSIAKQHGHTSRLENDSARVELDAPMKHEVKAEEVPKPSYTMKHEVKAEEVPKPSYTMKHEVKAEEVPKPSHNQPNKVEEAKMKPEKSTVGLTGNHKSPSPRDLGVAEGKKESVGHERNESSEKAKKRTREIRKKERDPVPDDKQKERSSLPRLSEPRHSPLGREQFDQFDRSLNSSRMHYERGSSPSTKELYGGSTHGRLDGGRLTPPDYGIRHTESQFPGYQRGSIDRGYSRSYADEARSSMGQRNSYFAGNEPSLQPSYVAPPSYNGMGTSTMQRYAPRLDELNHTRLNSLAPEPMVNRSGAYGHPVPRPGPYDHPIPGPGPCDHPVPGPRGPYDDPLARPGYAPGPYRTFPQNGWLNE